MSIVATERRACECTHATPTIERLRVRARGHSERAPAATAVPVAILSAVLAIEALRDACGARIARACVVRAMYHAIGFVVRNVRDRERLYGLLGLASEYCEAFDSQIDERT